MEVGWTNKWDGEEVRNRGKKRMNIQKTQRSGRRETRELLAVPWLRRIVAGFPPRRPGFDSVSGHVGFVVDKVALGQVFFEYFGFPCQSLFHQLLHNHHHLSSGAGTIGQ
jgi:hypothetical protein